MAYLDGGGLTYLWAKIKGAFLGKNDKAYDSARLGGKMPEYYIQPANLLDNSDFLNPVAQAGVSGLHGSMQSTAGTEQRALRFPLSRMV